MRLKRKVLALVTTASMVLGLFGGAASAGTFSDVPADKSYAGAVERLAGLGVVQGVGGGKYDPEGQYTRAQFAALAVRLRGIKTAGSGATDFSDVPSTHWASGWINLATGLGIIKGMGDGTFRPDDPVTHAQALTMLLRAMGYEPALKKGTWPSNVLARAALLGLDKGVNVVPNLPATRGEVAMFADNALTAPLMVLASVDADGKESYKEDDTKSIASTYLKATAVEGTLISSPELFGTAKDKIIVDDNNAVTNDEYTLTTAANYTGLLAHKVKAWKDKDGKVFFIEDKTASSSVKTAKVVDDNADGTVDGLKIGDKTYRTADLTAWASTVRNYVVDNTPTLAEIGSVDNGEVTVILNDSGQIAYVVARNSTVRIVDSVSTGLENITFSTDLNGGSLSVKDATVNWVGAASKLADLQKGDVVEYVSGTDIDGKAVINITVTRNNKSGTLDRNVGIDKVKVGGVEYTLASGVAQPGNAMLGKTVSLYLNKHGKVVLLKSGALGTTEPAKPVAIVTKTPYEGTTAQGPVTYVAFLKSDGTMVYAQMAEDAVVDADNNGTNDITAWKENTMGVADLTGNNVDTASIVEYSLNASGAIDKLVVLYDGQPGSTTTITPVKDPSRFTWNAGANMAAVTTDTIVFDVTGSTYRAVAGSSLIGAGDFTGSVVTDGVKARAAIMTVGPVVAVDYKFGIVVNKAIASGPKYYLNLLLNGGNPTEYEVTLAEHTAAVIKGIAKFRIAGTKAENVANVPAESVQSATYGVMKIFGIDGTNKIVETREYESADENGNGISYEENPDAAAKRSWLVNDKTQYFKKNGDNVAPTNIQFTDLGSGQKVWVYDDDNNSVAEAIVIE